MTSLMFSHVDHDEFVEKDGIFPFLNIKTFFLSQSNGLNLKIFILL